MSGALFVGVQKPVLLALVMLCGCISQEPLQSGESVVSEVYELGDIDVSGGVIRWKDGRSVHAASVEQRPVFNAENAPIAETGARLLVADDTVYVADNFGVSALTNGASRRVIDEDFVRVVAIADDGSLVWGHAGWVSWGTSHVLTPGNSSIDDIVVAGDTIYVSVTTITLRGLQYGVLYRVSRTSRDIELVAPATSFPNEFDEYMGQDQSCGLYEVAGHVYWCIEGEGGVEGGPRMLLAEVTPKGLVLALPPQKISVFPQRANRPFVERDGTFYWATTEDDGARHAVWQATPGGAPRKILENGVGAIKAIDGGYVYGVAQSPYHGGLDVMRVALDGDVK